MEMEKEKNKEKKKIERSKKSVFLRSYDLEYFQKYFILLVLPLNTAFSIIYLLFIYILFVNLITH